MTIRQFMEFLRMGADLEVDELMDHHSLQHPAGHGLQAMGDTDITRRRRR